MRKYLLIMLGLITVANGVWALPHSPTPVFLPANEMSISTNVEDPAGKQCGALNDPCPLYANENQQVPIYINYNFNKHALPNQFPADYYESPHLTFVDAYGNKIIIGSNVWVDGIKITKAPNGYVYGQIGGGAVPVQLKKGSNVTPPENEFFVSFQNVPSNYQRIQHVTAQLDPGGGARVITSRNAPSPLDAVYVTGVEPYLYKASDFVLKVKGSGYVNGASPAAQGYNYGYLTINNPKAHPGYPVRFHAVAPARFDTQNYLGGSSTAPVDGLQGIMNAKLASGPAYFYENSQWSRDAIYYSTQSISDPDDSSAVVLPFYEMHPTSKPIQVNTVTCTAIMGTDMVTTHPITQTYQQAPFEWQVMD